MLHLTNGVMGAGRCAGGGQGSGPAGAQGPARGSVRPARRGPPTRGGPPGDQFSRARAARAALRIDSAAAGSMPPMTSAYSSISDAPRRKSPRWTRS